jgi:hypothetical protein
MRRFVFKYFLSLTPSYNALLATHQTVTEEKNSNHDMVLVHLASAREELAKSKEDAGATILALTLGMREAGCGMLVNSQIGFFVFLYFLLLLIYVSFFACSSHSQRRRR